MSLSDQLAKCHQLLSSFGAKPPYVVYATRGVVEAYGEELRGWEVVVDDRLAAWQPKDDSRG